MALPILYKNKIKERDFNINRHGSEEEIGSIAQKKSSSDWKVCVSDVEPSNLLSKMSNNPQGL
jgi:hypothetical protein